MQSLEVDTINKCYEHRLYPIMLNQEGFPRIPEGNILAGNNINHNFPNFGVNSTCSSQGTLNENYYTWLVNTSSYIHNLIANMPLSNINACCHNLSFDHTITSPPSLDNNSFVNVSSCDSATNSSLQSNLDSKTLSDTLDEIIDNLKNQIPLDSDQQDIVNLCLSPEFLVSQ